MTGRPALGLLLGNIAVLWLAMAIAAVGFWPIYEHPQFVVLVAVSVVVGTLIATAGALWRWPSIAVLGATVLAFLVLGVPLAVPSRAQFGVLPTLEGLQELVPAIALSWKQLLTITLPVADYETLLVPALVLFLLATVVGLSALLRARRRELGVLAPVAVYVVALALGPDVSVNGFEVTLALAIVVLLWLVWLRWYRRREAIRLLAEQSGTSPSDQSSVRQPWFIGLRAVLSAAVVLALVSAAAVATAVTLPPSNDRTVARSAIIQPFDPRDYVSPLSGFRNYWQPDAVDDVLLRVTGLPAGARLRLATLDTYNGRVYSVGTAEQANESGSFTRVPSRFDRSGISGENVDIDVDVVDYSGVWMPTVGQFVNVAFTAGGAQLRDEFYYNDVSGTAAVLGELGLGDSYSLSAVIPRQPSREQLSQLEAGSAAVPTAREVPAEVAAKLDEYVSGVEGRGAQLVALLDGLAAEGYISHGIADDEPPSRSGHAADRIAELLTESRMIGDAEQYAVAAALMAREIGFPARVVMGFAPDGDEVRGSDVTAWIEVDTARYGWVTIDPTPPVREIPEEEPEEASQVARPQTVIPPPVVESEPFDQRPAPDVEQDDPEQIDPFLQTLALVLRIAAWVLLALGVLAAPFLFVVAAKLRRRRLRQRASDPTARIVGGWREFEDAVSDRGMSPAPTATRNEIARVVGIPQSYVLAAVADRAFFAPDSADDAEADRVWHAVEELRLDLDSRLTLWQRIRARIAVRSLVRNSRGYTGSKLSKR